MKTSDFNKLSKEEKKQVKFKDKPTSLKIVILLVPLFFILMIGTCTRSCFDSSPSVKKTGIDSTELIQHASLNAQQYIKSVLKSPSSTEFSDGKVWLLKDSTAVVKGNVDSQNSFGAMLRSSYSVILKWYGDFTKDENWKVLEGGLE